LAQDFVPGTQMSHCLPFASQSPGWHVATKSKPFCTALHFSRLLPVQRYWFGTHVLAVHAPAPALHSGTVAHVS
jgi:hypothetical protein